MATNVLMPKWGMSMQNGLVGCWLKKEGDRVEQGEEIVEVESDKAINFIEAPVSGVLARILVPEGETVPITTVLATIAALGEEIPESIPPAVRPGDAADTPSAGQAPDTKVSDAQPSAPRSRSRSRVSASPAARRLAGEHHIHLPELQGTGPDGMIVVEDVRKTVTSQESRVKSSGLSTLDSGRVSKVVFYSQGYKLDGILYLPKDDRAGRALPGIVFCLGFTYVKELLVPEMARRLSSQGYACLVFDYRGFGKSEGPPARLIPLEQVADIQAAVTFLAERPEVDADRIGLVGISLGGSHALWVAAMNPRVQAAAAIAPVGNGRRWLRGSRRYWEWVAFLEKIADDRTARVLGGEGSRVDAWDIVAPDPESRAFLEDLYREFPAMTCDLSLESAEALIDYCPENMVSQIAPRPLLLVHGEADLLVPADESRSLFAKAGEPRELLIVPGMAHFDWANRQDEHCDAVRSFEHVMEIVSRWLGNLSRTRTAESAR